ncbi:MAG TPA: hypothetical protein VMM13_21045 [Euzebya sp.]|nr:hypothetical protein [Euzebya sp.]
MTTQSPFGVDQSPRAPSSVDVVPTWRDLPEEPPYGPVLPPRTPNLGLGFPTVVVEQDAAITPGQIAMAVGGTLLLVAIGIGAALMLLGDDDTPVADVSQVSTPSDPVPEDGLTPIPPPVSQQPAPEAPQGELQPEPRPQPADPAPQDSEDAAPDDQAPDDQAPGDPVPDGRPPEGPAPDAVPGDPAPAPDGGPDTLQPQPMPGAGEEGSIELPRLFRLRTLPSGAAEDATTVRQTTRGDDVLTEQITVLTAEEGEIEVSASRDGDAGQRLEDVITDDAEELNVRGLPAYLVDGRRLVWLMPGEEETLIEIEAPPAVGTEDLLTIANGLELLR